MSDQQRLNYFANKITDLVEEFSDLPLYELGSRLIANATSMMLFTAPDELVAMKTVMAAVEIGISEYQENFS